jgi:hypothetical protein
LLRREHKVYGLNVQVLADPAAPIFRVDAARTYGDGVSGSGGA